MTYVQQRIITRGPGISKTFPYARCPQYVTDRIPPFSFCAQQERLTTATNNTSSFVDYVTLNTTLEAIYYQYEFFADVEALAGEVISIRLMLDKGLPGETIVFQHNMAMFKSALATAGAHTFTLDFASLGTSTVSVHTGYISIINYEEAIII
ncbi:MAG: hypothetical protein ACYSWP_15000 [Planctomycetota bacterium]|jgi:hypothetical protein